MANNFKTIYILFNFNNYYNRILKRYDTLTEYLQKYEYTSFTNINFNPNDSISTELILNMDEIWGESDYILVVNPSVDSESNDAIISRWYITECNRTRLGQYTLKLQRDLLADNYEDFISSPAFIERGMLADNDPYIFNDEGLKYNQIKQSETKLYDASNCAWIVGYTPQKLTKTWTEGESEEKSIDNTDFTYTAPVSYLIKNPKASFTDVADLQNRYPNLYNMLFENKVFCSRSMPEQIETRPYLITTGYITMKKLEANQVEGKYKFGRARPYWNPDDLINSAGGFNHNYDTSDWLNFNMRIVGSQIARVALTELGHYCNEYLENLNYFTQELLIFQDLGYDTTNFEAYLSTVDIWKDKIITIGTKNYEIKRTDFQVNRNGTANVSKTVFDTALANGIHDYNGITGSMTHIDIKHGASGDWHRTPTVSDFAEMTYNIEAKLWESGLSLQELNAEASITIPHNGRRRHAVDAVYDMFCIPVKFDEANFELGKDHLDDDTTITINTAAGLAIAQAFTNNLGSGNLYDLQVLPYCPIKGAITAKDTGDICELGSAGISEFSNKEQITINNSIVSYMFWCPSTSFNTQIHRKLPGAGTGYAWEIENASPKVQRCTQKYRLTAGNYAGIFEFVPAMNNGFEQLNVYCDYKPYQPFVKVNPKYEYMYGNDFKDATGLILSGDFSLTVISDAWENYKLQNKNYQASFDRNIQSLTLQQSVQMQEAIFGAASGTVSSTASGALNGAKIGGAAGAVIGGIVGAGAGIGGGIADIYNLDRLQQDTVSNRKAQFEYNLQNIQAIPDTIQKISSMTQINKVVPVLEFYKCTDEELNAFNEYIKYNGMTIGRIGKLNEYVSNGGYIQGRFLRLNNVGENYRIAYEMNKILETGLYLDEGEE